MSLALGTIAGTGSSFAQGTTKTTSIDAVRHLLPQDRPSKKGAVVYASCSTCGAGAGRVKFELNKVVAAAASESKATFYVTYTSSGSGSRSGAVSIAQKPPEQMFKTSTGEAIYNGKTAYYCGEQGSSWSCVLYPSIGASPIEAVVSIYGAGIYVEAMQGWEDMLAANLAGVHIKFTSAKFAGQPSTCVTWSYKGSSAEYCVTNKGILAYAGGGSGSSSSTFELTYYSPHVSSSDFNLPKGAKVISI